MVRLARSHAARTASDGPVTEVRALGTGFPATAFDAIPGGVLGVGVHLDTPAIFAFEGLRLPR